MSLACSHHSNAQGGRSRAGKEAGAIPRKCACRAPYTLCPCLSPVHPPALVYTLLVGYVCESQRVGGFVQEQNDVDMDDDEAGPAAPAKPAPYALPSYYPSLYKGLPASPALPARAVVLPVATRVVACIGCAQRHRCTLLPRPALPCSALSRRRTVRTGTSR